MYAVDCCPWVCLQKRKKMGTARRARQNQRKVGQRERKYNGLAWHGQDDGQADGQKGHMRISMWRAGPFYVMASKTRSLLAVAGEVVEALPYLVFLD